jgi:hypothetical protein
MLAQTWLGLCMGNNDVEILCIHTCTVNLLFSFPFHCFGGVRAIPHPSIPQPSTLNIANMAIWINTVEILFRVLEYCLLFTVANEPYVFVFRSDIQ